MKRITIPIKGMHCRACEMSLSKELGAVKGVKHAEASLKDRAVYLTATTPPSTEAIRQAVRKAGYEVGIEKLPFFSRQAADYQRVLAAAMVVAVLVMAWIVFDLDALTTAAPTIGGGDALVGLFTGVIAGVSTCMALVGGLVLGLSAQYSRAHPEATRWQTFRPHLFFNLGRVVAFFVLGGLLGLLGSVFQLSGVWLGVLTIGVGVVMALLGLQLTGLFPRLGSRGVTLPPRVARALGVERRQDRSYSHVNASILGVLSFFLPCGFTQAMQLYAMSTGSIVAGALVMGMFAIGTAPGLLGVGGLASVFKGKAAQRFFAIAGVLVIVLAAVNIGNGYRLTGWQFSLPRIQQSETNGAASTTGATVLSTVYTAKDDITPHRFEAEVNKKYVLEVDSRADGLGCMSTIMIPGLYDTPIVLRKDKMIRLSFMATRAGDYTITCAMGVPRGTITVR